MTKNRIYQLDLFRFFAALSVVLFHYLFRGWAADDMSELHFDEIGEYFKYGYLGVHFFFMISGFVILLSIKHNSISKFIVSRISRLYPIYWFCVILTFLVIEFNGSPRYSAEFDQFMLNLTMFQNYFGVDSIDGVYWSLFIEMKFYIFVVGTYLLLNKKNVFTIDKLLSVWLILTFLNIPLKDVFIFKAFDYFFILEHSSYFIAGILFYQIYKTKVDVRYFMFLLISFGVSLYYAFQNIENLEGKYKAVSFSNWDIGLILFAFYFLMYLLATKKLNWLNSPKLSQFGLITYPLYLIHQNIGFIVFNEFSDQINKYVLFTITTIGMILLSYLLSKFYEPLASGFLKKKLENLLYRN